jgi:succinate dehydrogenase/fumarate reductase cytochrome b subunit
MDPVCNNYAIQYFKQSITKAFFVVHIVNFGATKKCTLTFPLSGAVFLNPVASDGKIAISVASLPCITCDVYHAANGITLIDDWLVNTTPIVTDSC